MSDQTLPVQIAMALVHGDYCRYDDLLGELWRDGYNHGSEDVSDLFREMEHRQHSEDGA